MTHDTGHVTHDRWGRWKFSKNFGSLAPPAYSLVFEVSQKWIRYSSSGLPEKPWRFVTEDWRSTIYAWHSPEHQWECVTRGLQQLTDLYGQQVYLRLIWKAYSHQLWLCRIHCYTVYILAFFSFWLCILFHTFAYLIHPQTLYFACLQQYNFSISIFMV